MTPKWNQKGGPGKQDYSRFGPLDPPRHQTRRKTTPGHQNIIKSDLKAPQIHKKALNDIKKTTLTYPEKVIPILIPIQTLLLDKEFH